MGTKLPRVKMREDGSYKLKIISEMQGFSVFVVAKWLREQELKGLYSSGRAADERTGDGVWGGRGGTKGTHKRP